jgi:hypothetical protein
LLKHRAAVAVRAHQVATNAVKASVRRHGLKLSELTARDIRSWADLFLDDHRAELVASAERDIATWPGFEPWRIVPARQLCAELKTNAQTKIESISKGSAVQISGAK